MEAAVEVTRLLKRLKTRVLSIAVRSDGLNCLQLIAARQE